jgi:SAM-dependent methyltransferase
MENIRVDETGREATAGVSFGSWRQRIAQEETSEHLVHPATLDCLFHAMFAAIWNPDVASTRMVPTHLSEVYASVKLLDETTSTNLNLHARIVENDHYCMVGDVSAGGNNIHNPYLLMRGCRLTKLHAVEKTGANEPSSTSLFHHVDWKPDISLLTPKQIEDYIREHTASQIDLNMDSRAEIVCRHFISKVFEKLDNISLKTSKPHFLNYMKWVRNFNYSEEESTKELIRNEWPSFEADETKEQLIDEWATSVPWGTQIVLFCKNIIPIMREEIDPLDILFNQGVAESIYRSPLLKLTACRLASYVDLVAHKNSRIRILEVGAGTGSATSSVLELLWRQGNYAGLSPRFVRYDFTDISPSFFAHAQEKFRPYLSAMSFKVLNLENDPIEQGFEPGSYDIIIAAAVSHIISNGLTLSKILTDQWQVIHATASIAKTLDYVKLLLKP